MTDFERQRRIHEWLEQNPWWDEAVRRCATEETRAVFSDEEKRNLLAFLMGLPPTSGMPPPKLDRRIRSLAFFLPRTLREDIVGDVYEDIAEMRADGLTERQISRRVCSIIALSVLRSIPSSCIRWVVLLLGFGRPAR